MRLLIVEDDARLSDVLRRGLSEQGHVVDIAENGEDGLLWAREGSYDGVVLDLNLPRRDGLSILRELRAVKIATPILVLTSRDTPEDVVEGLDAGADDYLRKPFAFAELHARLRAMERRATLSTVEPTTLSIGDLVLDLRSRKARRGKRDLDLTPRESVFLEFFLRRNGGLTRRSELEHAVFDRESGVVSNVIDVYVSRLRAKLVAGGEPQLLHTVRRHGFRFEAT